MARWLITFPSIYHTFRAERLLNQNRIQVETVPVPRSLSGSCEGMAVQVKRGELEAAVDLLTKKQVDMLHKGIEVCD